MFAEVCISLALIALVVFVFFAVRTRRTSSNRFSLLLVGIFVSTAAIKAGYAQTRSS